MDHLRHWIVVRGAANQILWADRHRYPSEVQDQNTFGLRQLIANLAAGDASHIVSDITDGFYVNSDSYFKMAGAIGAGFGTSVANVFPVDISGGIYTQNSGLDPVHVYIEDPNADGKLRFNEFHLDSDKPASSVSVNW